MQHIGTQTIETERLILRRFVSEDAQAMFENWASDPEVTRFLTWPAHESVKITRMVLADWIARYEKPDFYQWAIVLRDSDLPVGSISVVYGNDRIQMAHVGYCLGRRWWRQGIMTEALGAVMEFLFDQVGVNRIETRHAVENPNSGAVMKKCGMHYEGTLRQADWCNEGVVDVCCYALLKSER